jgi:hypothetical protein
MERYSGDIIILYYGVAPYDSEQIMSQRWSLLNSYGIYDRRETNGDDKILAECDQYLSKLVTSHAAGFVVVALIVIATHYSNGYYFG